jgi:hypothetical protein
MGCCQSCLGLSDAQITPPILANGGLQVAQGNLPGAQAGASSGRSAAQVVPADIAAVINVNSVNTGEKTTGVVPVGVAAAAAPPAYIPKGGPV